MSKTSLYNEHVKLGAKIVDFAGWDMPIQYKKLKEEVKAIRENIGVFDVGHMGEFFVEGNEALKFVDYLVTNDVHGAEDLKAIYSPLCRENGTIIDDLIVYKISNSKLMICVNASNIEKDFKWIEKQSNDFDVTISNRSDSYSLLAVQGPNTFEVLNSLNLETDLKDIQYYSLQIDNPQLDVPVIFARTGYTGEDGFEIFGPHEYIKSIWKQLIDKGVTPCGLGARDVLRLEVCYPLYGNELNDKVTPLDSTLKWAVRLNKNSFIGKDFLSDYEPSSRLIKFTLDKGIPREGYPILNDEDEKIGIVTSGTMSVVLGVGIAIARVDKAKFNKDSNYFVEIRNKKFPINYKTKPFITGGHK